MTSQSGVTYIEILAIIGIMGIVSFISTPFFSNMIMRNNATTGTEMVISVFRKAQHYAMNNKHGTTWGVCLSGGKVRVFSGTCQAPVWKEDTSVPAGVTITGLSEMTFSSLRGEPSSAVSVNVVSGNKTKTININLAGGMDVQ